MAAEGTPVIFEGTDDDGFVQRTALGAANERDDGGGD
jgi:hypothetical protein